MVRIGEVKFAEPKFAKGPSDFDICIHVTSVDDPGQADWWRGEVSQNYGKGNFATMTQAEITLKTLRNVGFEGDDLTTLADQLGGKEVPAMIKATEKDGKTYYNVQYIGAGGGDVPVEIAPDEMKRRCAALFGGKADAATTPAPAPAAAPKPAGGNPFAPKAGGAAASTTGARKSPF